MTSGNFLQYIILKCIRPILLCWYSMVVGVSIWCLMIRSWNRSWDLFTLALVLRPFYFGLGLESWWLRSWSPELVTKALVFQRSW